MSRFRKMAAGELDGFGIQGLQGLDGEGGEESHDGYGDVQIPDIYQRIFVRPEQDYVHEADDTEPESDQDDDDYDLSAPPLES